MGSERVNGRSKPEACAEELSGPHGMDAIREILRRHGAFATPSEPQAAAETGEQP